MVFDRLKRMIRKRMVEGEEDVAPEFIEIDLEQNKTDSKVIIKTFVLRSYEDLNPILNSLRDGYTIAAIDIRQLKSKDIIELKRVISKIKKTVDALEGSIAGFGENVVIATPSFAKIQKGYVEEKPKDEIERF